MDEVKYYQQHVRAEFYAAGVGWVPVDLASAVERDPSPAGLRFFGHDRGDFLVLHIDPILRVDTLFFGEKTLPWLQGVHYWGAGRAAWPTRSSTKPGTSNQPSSGPQDPASLATDCLGHR